MSLGHFAKFQNILGNLENYTHVQKCAYTQKRTEKSPNLPFLADFEALHKKQMKSQAE